MYIKNISRYLRYGSSHGGSATPQPGLTVFDSKTGQRGSRTSKTPPTSHIKKCIKTKKFLRVIFSEFTYAIQPITDTKQFMNLGDPGVNFCIVSVKSWITAQVTMNTQISTVSPKSTSGIGRRPPSYILHSWISAAHHCIYIYIYISDILHQISPGVPAVQCVYRAMVTTGVNDD